MWAFGSRATGAAKPYSDLDLCIVSDHPLDLHTQGALVEDFVDSELPFRVDLVDWSTTSVSFRAIIEKDKVFLQSTA